jgi:hypothetical protein
MIYCTFPVRPRVSLESLLPWHLRVSLSTHAVLSISAHCSSLNLRAFLEFLRQAVNQMYAVHVHETCAHGYMKSPCVGPRLSHIQCPFSFKHVQYCVHI